MTCQICDGNPIETEGKCASCRATERKEARRAQKRNRITQVQRSAKGQVKRSKIRKVSEKQKESLKTYSKLKAEFMKGKVCPIYPHLPVEDIHHRKGRIGALLLDQTYWLAVSRKGHT